MNDLMIKANVELELRKRRAERLVNFESQKAFYRENPLEYIHDRLDIPKETILWSLNPAYENHNWDGDKDPLFKMMDSIAKGFRRIGVEAATGTQKTHTAACIALWFLDNFDDSLVVTTAPKQDQLSLHIWKEIGKLHSKFGKGKLLDLKLQMNPGSNEHIIVGFVAGVAANEESTTKAQGFHAENMLIILEETPGIPQPTITAFQNTAEAPNNIILALGNPDNEYDNLHRFCTLKDTVHIRISGLDHPNIITGNPLFVPGAKTIYGLNDLLARCGGNDEAPMYLSRGRGIPPKQAADSLIRMEWIIQSVEKYKEYIDPQGRLIKDKKIEGLPALGVDVANSEAGDEAAICEGIGNLCLKVNAFQCPDANQLGKRDVVQAMRRLKARPENIGIDGVGVGAGTINALNEIGIKVQNLIGGASAIKINNDEQQPKNLRSQMYWQAREDLRSNEVIIPNDLELHADLVAPKWKVIGKTIVVESKEDIKKRLGRSPNKGDAFVYWNWIRKHRRLITAGESPF